MKHCLVLPISGHIEFSRSCDWPEEFPFPDVSELCPVKMLEPSKMYEEVTGLPKVSANGFTA